jgi:carbamoyltransferase
MWIPPFPNDSGSALGVAVLGRTRRRDFGDISWHPRLGPALAETAEVPADWEAHPCTAEELAGILHESGEPVVVLNGRAELGPRALGARSILAAAVRPAMKDELNRVKRREYYRPVAPVCLVEDAPEIFDPGSPDPHMLFEHVVRTEWVQRIPAVVHLDGTARLQTVAAADDPFLAAVLRAYRELSGIPVLCNTSANFHGRGFLPDVASAIAWGEVPRVWSEGKIYRRRNA